MDLVAVLLVGLLVGVVLGGLVGWLAARSRSADSSTERVDPEVLAARHERAVAEVRAAEAAQRAEVERELASTAASVEGLRRELSAAEARYRSMHEQHDRERRQRERAQEAESKVLQQLAPVQKALSSMQQKVEDLEQQRREQHGRLAEQIRNTQQSADQSRRAAETLASALKNNAVRGQWGETQLRSLVESAGLLNRVDFDLQASIQAESGARRPDMVLRLPGGKSVAVDAKVPYNAYIEAMAIPDPASEEQEDRRRVLLVQHAEKVRSHVNALASKQYWTGLEVSPEFTIAFIPNEPLLAAALEQDPSLLEDAFAKRIALASPVSFWAVLKTVAFTWQQEALTEDAKTLFDLGKELYQRIGTLTDHADKLRRSIESTVESYNKFAGSLEGRVLATARKLDNLDETKVLGEPTRIEKSPRRLTRLEAAAEEVAARRSIEDAALAQTGVDRPELVFEAEVVEDSAGERSNEERAG
ncbi:DNA recombination protein RmuC [Mumia flava]|uniref:DNA recombination protein RmuC n=1 Tax=Mumia flava TaxID=1348852 RepID=A0A2M9BGG5_9ACTN|nr:DNA recombination protein RmuC [Mumia flava]PJJ57019.1 DNA recombination protein RmuC [Mumia flava]